MKILGFITMLALAAGYSSFAQTPSTNQPPLQGSAVTRLPPLDQPRPRPVPMAVLREPSTSGILPSINRGTLFKPLPQPEWWSPVQNPEIDVVTRRPRGIVLFSFDF